MARHATDQENCYSHLSAIEREEIAVGLEQGESLRRIAATPGGSPSSGRREIKRNAPPLRNAGRRGTEPVSGRQNVRAYVQSHPANGLRTPEEVSGRR